MNRDRIEALEQQYKTLFNKFQHGQIDESTLIAEVDQLQFQDDWGRYWMVGAQSGAWHYFDGHNWHEADPRDADKLPFVDEAGRYWQRGAKSGDWYYYQPDTGEWVKPSPDEAQARPQQTYMQPQATGPATPTEAAAQVDGELFQDAEGRYWAVGSKSGQWYFYDYDGWHPAHEFHARAGQQAPAQMPYQPIQHDSRPYQPQPYPAQPMYQQQPMPVQPQYVQQPMPQAYVVQQPMQQPVQQPAQQPVQPQPQQQQPPQQPQNFAGQPNQPQPTTEQAAPPPPADSGDKSGGWYYFDGKQWMRYESNGSEEEKPAPPAQATEAAKPQQEEQAPEPAPKKDEAEPAVAEFYAEEEPPVEVVDVEVITVVDAEDETVVEEAPPVRAPQARTPTQANPVPQPSGVTPRAMDDEEVTPRRATRPVNPQRRPQAEGAVPRRQSRGRTPTGVAAQAAAPTDVNPVVSPRQRDMHREPTNIAPASAAAAGIASGTPARPSRPAQPEVRRARENTAPMDPATRPQRPAPAARHRDATQPLPAVPMPTNRVETGQMRATPTPAPAAPPKPKRTRTPSQPTPVVSPDRAKAKTGPIAQPAGVQPQAKKPAPTAPPQPKPEPQKRGYTFGDVLRSLPSTVWAIVLGVGLMILFAVGVVMVRLLFPIGDVGPGSIAISQSPTPTLAVGIPDTTPTPGPTATPTPAPVGSPTPAALATFNSNDLGFSIAYPDGWQTNEEPNYILFSETEGGLSRSTREDTAIWIGRQAGRTTTISDFLEDIMAEFPDDARTLSEGTISIASQPWTSAHIRFDDENLGGEGIASLAVTTKDGQGYYLVFVAPAEEWNGTRPLFQEVMNSFSFDAPAEENVPAATAQTQSDEADEDESSSTAADDADEEAAEEEPTATEADEDAAETAASEADEEATEEATEEEEEETDAEEATATPARSANADTPGATPTPFVYEVQSGDSPAVIAARFGITTDELIEANSIVNPSALQIGEELVIPISSEEAAAAAEDIEAEAEEAATDEAAASDAAEEEAVQPEVAPAAAAPQPLSGKIAYGAFNPGTNIFDLWLADIATEEQTIITDGASQPAFNSDGSLLAYRSWRIDRRGIYFIDFIGGREGQVTKFVEDGLPSWAPDGFSFAFASRREGDRIARIYRGNQSGTEDYSIGFNGEYPAVMPDGRIVAKGCLPTGDCGMFIMGPQGGGEIKISSNRSDTAPAPSPDGSQIAFMSNGRGANNWEIWVMNADGSDPVRLTENAHNDGLPTWSPDGSHIAFVSDANGVWSIWAMEADGDNPRKLFNMKGTPEGYVLHDKDNSRGWLEERISWAP